MSKKTITVILLSIAFAGLLGMLVPVDKAKALNGNFAQRVENRASAAATKQTADLSRLQQRGNTMIQVRLTSLQNLLTRVGNDKRLSDDGKNSFTTDINSTISNLNSLKTKLDADTDAATALADAKSIVTAYRIYMIYEPKTRLLVVIDNLQTASTTIATLVTKVQGLLDSLKTQGKNVASAQTALDDASSQLTSINTLLATDKTLLTNVTIATSDPQSVFTQVRKDLATVRSDVVKIRTDFMTVKTNIKSLTASPAAPATSPIQ